MAEKKENKNREFKKEKKKYDKYAVILIRSRANLNYNQKHTLDMLNLYKIHNCVVVEWTPSVRGMINKIKHVVTYGKIDDSLVELLGKKRKIKDKTYCLHPPRGGYERKGVKMPYSLGGANGLRDNIGDLIKKML